RQHPAPWNPVKLSLGDSNTEGWTVPPNFLEPRHIQERGIAGDMTWGVLERINQPLHESPTKIYLIIGTNDLGAGTTVDQLLENCPTILDSIKPPIRVFCIAIPPINNQIMAANGISTSSTSKKIFEAN
ncbi:GDSL-type esterase/lipase family protein, partial [Oceanidesulfovibrio marinus]|uniref:GDSL-type esterase/lipase family protein n=1 Tax=Oceanidesulfovibrio marinus TaxID=370038 RepID=UPI002E2724A5